MKRGKGRKEEKRGDREQNRKLKEDLSMAGSLHMGDRLPGYSGEKLQSKFKPGEEEREAGVERDEKVREDNG